jgi:uncharacterized protein (TIGR00255 family)
LIRSMTGFGLGEAEADGLAVRVEVRTVNHRFLQARYRLPAEFADLEPRVDQALKKRLSRGSVTLTAVATRAAAPTAVSVDDKVASRYVELLGRMAGELGVENDLKLSHLVGLPGVIATCVDETAHETESKILLTAVEAALENLVEMRVQEGGSLEADIRVHMAAIAELRTQIGARIPQVVQEHFDNLRRRAAEILGIDSPIDPADLNRELAILSEKTDVAEEVSRLDSHLEQLNSILGGGGEVGRKLDFLVQELNREANTIGSKAGDTQVAHAVVELKTHIERVREQVQNIE